MKVIIYLISFAVFILGILFLIAATTQSFNTGRIVTGLVLIATSIILVLLARSKTTKYDIKVTNVVDLKDETKLKSFKCRQCGAMLTKDNLKLEAGNVWVNCSYCNTVYKLEEDRPPDDGVW